MASAGELGWCEMPEVLDYASPQIRKRWRPSGDWLLAILALVQSYCWLLWLLGSHDRPIPGTFQWSLFAIAWRFSVQYFYLSLVGFVSTSLVFVAALLPPNRRYWFYVSYILVVPILNAVESVSWGYVLSTLQGNWRSLLFSQEYYPPDPVSFGIVAAVCPPVFVILLLRAVLPGERFVGK